MKITENHLYYKTERFETIIKLWEDAALNLSLETGVYIVVKFSIFRELEYSDDKVSRIYFQINNHEFESLTELKQALSLKAFL